MAFQFKSFPSITASMINWMKASTKKISDFTVGSVARTLLEAPAMEIDELYQQMFIGIKEAIPVAVYNSFNFDQIEAVSATGLIRVTIEPSANPTVFEAATTFTGTGLSTAYTSLVNTTAAAGASYVDIQVEADVSGTAGNIAAGNSFTLAPSPTNFVSATNLAAFVTGSDTETPAERKVRFAAYIEAINRSTKAGIVYGVKTANLTDSAGNIIEQVKSALIVEPYVNDPINNPIGLVECYIHNGIGGTSAELLALAQKIVDGYYTTLGTAVPGYKAAGIPCTLYLAPEQLVNVTGVLVALDGYDHATLVASASAAIFAYIQGLDIGQSCLYAELIAAVMDLDGVYNFTLSAPADDVAAAQTVKLMPGGITIP